MNPKSQVGLRKENIEHKAVKQEAEDVRLSVFEKEVAEHFSDGVPVVLPCLWPLFCVCSVRLVVLRGKSSEQARGGLITAIKQQDENYEAYELL